MAVFANNSIFGEGVVGVAIEPAFARLSRRDDGMAGRLGVFTGVAIRRTVAAKRHAAFLAGPQVDPSAADLHAFLAFETARAFDRFGRFAIGAFSRDQLMSVAA